MGTCLGFSERATAITSDLQAHIDDSEDDDACLGGYVSSTEHWAQFADEWDAVLVEEPRVPYLKTKEAMARPPRGAFEGLTTETVYIKT